MSPQKSRWYREPLLHFVVLAAVLFGLDRVVQDVEKERIVVSQDTVDYLVEQREALELRELSPQQRNETVEQFIEDEILYREAYRRGLDRSDSRMRRNLILKMRGLLAGEVQSPSQEELRRWYEEHLDLFVDPKSWSLEQVFFGDAESVPAELTRRLNDGLDPKGLGEERLDARRVIPRATQSDLVNGFGSEAARTIVAIEGTEWHGPIESEKGVHLVRVIATHPARARPYDEVERYVEGQWRLSESRNRIEDAVNTLREDYEVVIEGENGER